MQKCKIRAIIAALVLSLWGARLLAVENGVLPPTSEPVPIVAPAVADSTTATPPASSTGIIGLPKTSAAAELLPAPVEELKPSVFYLPDKEGKLQAVFDFSYEDFIELYKLKRQLDQKEQRPRYTLEKLTASGKVEGNRAELTIHVQIALHDADWVRIPLRFDQGLLLQPATYQGHGELIVQYLGASDGYAAWLRGPTDNPHEIELRLTVPIVTTGAAHKLKLYVPRAAISELRLHVADHPLVVQGSEGVTVLPPAAAASGSSEITARGLGGDTELSWSKTGDSNAPAPTVLEAVGSILARLDDRGVSSEATLTLRSYAAPFDRFTVRLPEGTELTPVSNAGYTVSPVEGGQDSGERKRLVEVRLPKKVLGPVEVRLSCRRQLESKNPSAWWDLSGFEVVGATRQWGTLAAATSGDWQILWGASRGVQQIDQLPESLRVSGIAAGFEYFAQPFTLQVRLSPRRTRINVEPEYLLFVDRDRVRLDAKLTYTVHGAKVRALKILMPEWQLERVEPENLVAAEGIESDENGVLSIPLVEPTAGTIELRLKAQQMLEAETAAIAVTLPQLQGTASVSAVVAVSPADNIELTPDSSAILGLIRQQTALPLKLPERRQEPLFYRSEGKMAVFAADLRVHSRRITVEMTDRVQLSERSAQIEQKLAYTIDFDAVDHLLVDVPQSLAAVSPLAFEREDKPLAVKAMAPGEDTTTPAGMTRMRISLTEACLGGCTITARYAIALPALQAVKPAIEAIPLIVPAEGTILGNTLLLTSTPGMRASPVSKSWLLADKEPAHAGPQTPRSFKMTGTIDRAELEIGKEETSGVNATVIDRAWIQTWLTSSARQDRTVFQLLTNQNELAFKMPSGVELAQMAVLLDGKRIEIRQSGIDRLLIPLANEGELRRYTVEMVYHFSGSTPTAARMNLEFPQIGSGVWSRRLYWQLILPQNRHIIADPKGFVSEYHWGFQGYFWGRQPLLNQEELETWVGTVHRTAPSDGLNVYLFSTLGSPDGGEAWTASRAWIVLFSSGAALVIGLLMIYLPVLRHPVALLALAFALLSLGMIYPEPMILLAQTSSIGLGLALVAGLFVRLFPHHRRRGLEPLIVKTDIPSSRRPQPVPISAVSATTTQNLPTLLE